MSHDLLAIFDKINQIPWGDFEDAYGNAAVAKSMLRDLITGDEDEKQEAVNELLYSRAFHQYSVYSVIPSVAAVVLGLLKVTDLISKPTGSGRVLLYELIHFMRICVEGSNCESDVTLKGEIQAVVRSGEAVYELYTDHESKRVVEEVTWLLNFCRSPVS